MIEALLTGIGAGYGIAIPIGAVGVLIVETGLRRGFLAAEAAGAGTAAADGIYALIAATFGTALAGVLVPVARPLRAAAVLVLVAIAVRGLVAVVRERARDRQLAAAAVAVENAATTGPFDGTMPAPAARSVGRTYLAFLAITLANPMTVIYFAAMIIGLQATGTGPTEKAAFVAGAFGASLSWQSVLAAAGALLHHRLGSGLREVVSVVGSLIVLAFAASIAVGLATGA